MCESVFMDEKQFVTSGILKDTRSDSTSTVEVNDYYARSQNDASIYSALDLIKDAVIICDIYSKITYVNKKAEQLINLHKESLLGVHFDHAITIYNKLNMPAYLLLQLVLSFEVFHA